MGIEKQRHINYIYLFLSLNLNMLQHDGVCPVDCIYMDRPGHTVYLQVLVGESITWGLLQFVYPISSSFGLVFFVHSPQAMCCFALQICPYNAIKFLPRQQQLTGNPRPVLKQPLGENFVNKNYFVLTLRDLDSHVCQPSFLCSFPLVQLDGSKIFWLWWAGSEGKVVAAIPGSPDRTAALDKRLTKTERDILSLKTRIACDRASWEKRFLELQRKQEELIHQVAVKIFGHVWSLLDPWL